MSLSKANLTIWRKCRAAGSGAQGVGLDDDMSGYLLGRIILDLGLRRQFPKVPKDLPKFFECGEFRSPFPNPVQTFEKLIETVPDAVTYFACLARLLKSRLKYGRILSSQPFPTLEQVGPRGLLQYGHLKPSALTAFMFWRKWFMDVDNRAGQETGYLFEPLVAAAIGGIPLNDKKSPVRSHRDGKGRQVDCLIEKDAYELKVRVTIAASGQGRWREELDYPVDCRASGYRPMLLVLDGTRNPKLDELERAFEENAGRAFIGNAAWDHLDELAGPTMSRFLECYVRQPLRQLIDDAVDEPLPEFRAWDKGNTICLQIGREKLCIERHIEPTDDDGDELPEDVADEMPNAPG